MSSILQPYSFFDDSDSVCLIAQIQLQDALEISASRKGKGRVGSITDEEYAFEIQRQELDAWKSFHQDIQIAKSLDDALEKDRSVIEAYTLLEEVEAADRRAAEALSRGSALPGQSLSQRRVESPAFSLDAYLNQPEDISSRSLPDDADMLELNLQFDKISTGTRSRAGPSVDQYRKIQCVGCNDSFRAKDILQVPCEHRWCRTCIKDLVEVYLRDESLHPLRCCQQAIEPADASRQLSATLSNQFQIKRLEYEVLAQNRVYCAVPTCSSFLGSSVGLGAAATITCLQCQSRTCPFCKKLAHSGDDCTQNEAAEEVRALAQIERWQTCPGCSAIVELQHGCYHMTCTCRAQFCYLCGARWKTCACDQWDDARLLVAAERRAENELGEQVRVVQPEFFNREVRRVAEELRVNHDCVYHDWKGRSGGGTCEECYDYLPLFLKICRNCSLLVCRRCSLNRL